MSKIGVNIELKGVDPKAIKSLKKSLERLKKEVKKVSKMNTFQVGEDITLNESGKLYFLGGNTVALFFPYDTVNPTSVTTAFAAAGVQLNKYKCRFYPETPDTAGRKRLDSKFIQDRKPEVVEQANDLKLDLKNYVYVKIEGEASERGKRGKLPVGVADPNGSRVNRRKRAKKKPMQKTNIQQPKKRRKK